MLRKITIKVGLKSKVEPTLVFFNYRNFSVGPMLDIRQYANNDVLSTTPTITQRWHNDFLLSVPFSQVFFFEHHTENIKYHPKYSYNKRKCFLE